jgi:uncharacterized repeat protein (TIGR01451 family)
LKGLFADSLFGTICATLDGSKLPRTLIVTIERVDLGLPPAADLKIVVWGPGRASPGETIAYLIELRNDGLKSAENVTMVYMVPFLTEFVSASSPGIYDGVIHIVRWDFGNIASTSKVYLQVQVRIFWQLPQGTTLTHSAGSYPKETADGIFNHASPRLTEKQRIILEVIETVATSFLPDELGIPLSITKFLGEEPLTPVIIANYVRANRAAIDGRFEEAEYLRAVNTLLYNLQENPEYLKEQNKSFREAIEELAEIHGYTPPQGVTQISVARDPNVKHGIEGYVLPHQTLNYSVEYENEGEGTAFGVYFTDTLDEDLDESALQIGPVISTKNGSIIAGPGSYNPATRTITWLVGEVGSGEGGYANFSAKIRNEAPEGTEIINFATVHFPSVPEATRTNAIVSIVGQPDIAIKKFAPSEIVIDKGLTLCINVTVANEGYLTETFNLTIYANTTLIHTQNVTLIGRSNDTVSFLWNTTDFTIGNYTITAYVSPLPGEIDTNDNTLTFFPAQVIPEFTSTIILLLFMIATLAVTVLKRKHSTNYRNSKQLKIDSQTIFAIGTVSLIKGEEKW